MILAPALRIQVAWYQRQWSYATVHGQPRLRAAVLLAGAGAVRCDSGVTFAWARRAPGFLSGYAYGEGRHPGSLVILGDCTRPNHGARLVSEGPRIRIGRCCLIRPRVIYDSDFHSLNAAVRRSEPARRAAVELEDDLFLGADAMTPPRVSASGPRAWLAAAPW